MQPLILQLWGRLRRLARRFERLAARVRAGQRPAPQPGRPGRRPAAAGPPLPRGFAWLVRLAPETAVYGSQLQALLDDPQMAALLEAAPQAGRLVRPLCRMLGVRPGPVLALAPGSPRQERRSIPPGQQPPSHGLLSRPRVTLDRIRPRRLGSFLLLLVRDATGPPTRA